MYLDHNLQNRTYYPAGYTDNYFHKFDFRNIFDFALTVLGIDVSAVDSQGSFSP